MECKIDRTRGKGNDYTVTFNGMTRGAILALRQSLVVHSQAGSAVAADVLAFLDYGIKSSPDPDVCRAVIDAANIGGEITPGPCTVPGPPSTVPSPSRPPGRPR